MRYARGRDGCTYVSGATIEGAVCTNKYPAVVVDSAAEATPAAAREGAGTVVSGDERRAVAGE